MKRFALIFLLILCACGRVPARTSTNSPTDSQTQTPVSWTRIRMVHSGGIMGLMRTIEISKDGNASITDDRSSESKTLLLSDVELVHLNELIVSADFSSQAPRPDAACADCFIYDIELELAQGKPLHVQVNDVSMDASGKKDLIAFLRSLIDKGLQK